MRKKITFLLFFLIGIFQFIGAQSSEGHIAYNIEFSSEDDQMDAILGMMNGSTLDLYFTNTNTRIEMKLGTMSNTTTLIDKVTNKILILSSGSAGNTAIQGTRPDYDSTLDNKDEGYKIELTSETRKIIGFNAKKAIVTTEQGKTYDFWYTDSIKVDLKWQTSIDKKGFPGVVLEIVLNKNGIDMSYKATSYESKIHKKNEIFSMEIPEGYTVKSVDEVMQKPKN